MRVHTHRRAASRERDVEPWTSTLAETALRLQRAAGNRATAALLRAESTRVLQRAPHRPVLGSQVRYQGQLWSVQASATGNPQITIHRPPNHTVHLTWATANFTIIRPNNAQDADLREDDPGAAGGPVDAYAGLSDFDRTSKVRDKFKRAKAQALAMIKARASQSINQQSQASLDAITLEDFEVTRRGPLLIGAGKAQEPAEWQLKWIEGSAAAQRRKWTFTIDADNPLPDSSQDPHVGWTVSAEAGTQPGVANVFGHVWLDYVPVMRV